jgi:hypothetical protein
MSKAALVSSIEAERHEQQREEDFTAAYLRAARSRGFLLETTVNILTV